MLQQIGMPSIGVAPAGPKLHDQKNGSREERELAHGGCDRAEQVDHVTFRIGRGESRRTVALGCVRRRPSAIQPGAS
jgi:hypothetical protein